MAYNRAFAGDRGKKGPGCLLGLSAAHGRTACGWSCLSLCFPIGCWWCSSSWHSQGWLLTIQLVSALIPFAAFSINLESRLRCFQSYIQLQTVFVIWTPSVKCSDKHKVERCTLITKCIVGVYSSAAEIWRLNHSSLYSPSSLPSLLCHAPSS